MIASVVPARRVPVQESSQVAEARRVATALARKSGFDAEREGRLAIVATELAGNIVKHSSGGELLIMPATRRGRRGVDVLAIDRGPGMDDLPRSLEDGYSTAGSSGTGLGAVTRLADVFDAYSGARAGTVIFARLWAAAAAVKREMLLETAGWSLPKPGEEESGDGWAVDDQPGRSCILIVDGLGHGPQAAEAAAVALNVFEDKSTLPPAEIVREQHAALAHTRGAALAVTLLDTEAREVRYAGVGNTSGVILEGADAHHLISHNGIVGHELRRVQEFSYAWPRGATLLLHSDGLASWRSSNAYPGLLARHPAVIAGVLYRDLSRGYDDVTVLVTKEVA